MVQTKRVHTERIERERRKAPSERAGLACIGERTRTGVFFRGKKEEGSGERGIWAGVIAEGAQAGAGSRIWKGFR